MDATPSSEVYVSKVSEMWFVGREYIRSGQIKGINPSLAIELCARSYTTKERGKVVVESKVDVKKRIGRSVDLGDSAMLCLELCRRRLGMSSKVRAAKLDNHKGSRKSVFKAYATKLSGLRKW